MRTVRQSSRPCGSLLLALILLAGACSERSPSADPSPAATTDGVDPNGVQASDPAAPGRARPVELGAAARGRPTLVSRVCSFDTIDGDRIPRDGSLEVPVGTALAMQGWVVDEVSGQRPEAVIRFILLGANRAWEVDAGPGVARGDVARHLNMESLQDAGFELVVDTATLPAGDYALSVVHGGADGRKACDHGARFRLVQ